MVLWPATQRACSGLETLPPTHTLHALPLPLPMFSNVCCASTRAALPATSSTHCRRCAPVRLGCCRRGRQRGAGMQGAAAPLVCKSN